MNQVNHQTLTTMSWHHYAQKQSRISLFSFFFLVIGMWIFSQPTVYAQADLTDAVNSIDDYFSRLEMFGLSGSLLIGTKEEILLKKDYGIRPFAEGTDPAYLVGSLTKQFTATAILLLEQRGLLSTDDPISKYLPGIPSDKSAISIHQLLTHTSGLEDDYWDQHKELSEKAYIKMILSKKMVAEPGMRYRYINFGYHLLKKIVEAVSKKAYEQFLVEELLRPNGLKNTGFKLPKWEKGQVVQYTDWSTEGSESIIKDPLSRPAYLQPEGSGGLLSTTADLYKWYKTIFHSTSILTEASRKKLLSPEKEQYAYGWEVYSTQRGTKLIEHGGYDSWVGVVTGFYNFAEEDIVLIFLGNTHMSHFLIKEDLMNRVEAFIWGGDVPMPLSAGLIENEVDLGQLVGTYSKGERSLVLSKGKTNRHLRLRTQDEKVIRQLLLPDSKKGEKRTDIQLAYIFERIDKDDFESLEGQFSMDVPIEVIRNRFGGAWTEITASMGEYLGFEVLHTMPNVYEGKFELQLFVAMTFEKGTYYLRVFRNHNGRIHIQPIELPRKLEVYLAPYSEKEFLYWNVKTGISTKVRIDKNEFVLVDEPGEAFTRN